MALSSGVYTDLMPGIKIITFWDFGILAPKDNAVWALYRDICGKVKVSKSKDQAGNADDNLFACRQATGCRQPRLKGRIERLS
jgi:hypothetical protein